MSSGRGGSRISSLLSATSGQPLYDDAPGLLGSHGIADMLHPIGAYQFVCGLLNTFDIPALQGT